MTTMRYRYSRLLLLVLFVALGSSHSNGLGQELPRLDDVVRAASKDGRLVVSPAEELETARRLFLRTMTTASPERLADDWEEIGMELIRVADPIDPDAFLWVVREADNAKHGRGVYAVRPNAAMRYALQMPHSFHDRHTRALGLYIFDQTPIIAAGWNTIPRSQVDVAHVRFHYFNSFTTAFTEAHPASVVIQLHGFAQHKRSDPDACAADCIVSNGTRNPPEWVGEIAAVLDKKIADFSTRLFPSQVDDLGATKNNQALLIYGASTASFLHVEMSQPLRRALRKEANLRDNFFALILANCRS